MFANIGANIGQLIPNALTLTLNDYTVLKVAACVIGVVCMIFFNLDKYYDQAIADLAEGKWKGSK